MIDDINMSLCNGSRAQCTYRLSKRLPPGKGSTRRCAIHSFLAAFGTAVLVLACTAVASLSHLRGWCLEVRATLFDRCHRVR